MTRVRYDPAFIDDPRWEAIGAEGYVLHSAACSYVVRNLTDGDISVARVATLTPLVQQPLELAGRIIAAGIWSINGDGSYHVCDCIDDLRTAAGRGDEQPSRAFVEKERERARDRKAIWRSKQGGNAVPNGDQNRASGTAVQALPSPALQLDAEKTGNAVPNGDGSEPRGPCPPDIAKRARASRHTAPGSLIEETG
jgi:hypothetical protein